MALQMIDWAVVATVGVFVLGVLNAWLIVLQRQSAERERSRAQEIDSRLEDLRRADHDLHNQVQAINLLVQAQYLTRTEFREGMKDQTTLLENLFSRLETKIDRKADK